MTYAYGPGGQRTQLGVEGQGTVYYEYGPTGNMGWLLDSKTALLTYYEYDPAGRVRLQHHPNATATYFLYDAAGRLSEKVTKKDSDASVLVRFAYTRDAAGNPISIEREAALGAFYYDYDQLQRLAYEGQFIGGDREYENYYEYDAAGNRTLLRHGETGAEDLTYYAYNGANELTSLHAASGWTYFAYDANGNTVMEQAPSYTRYFDWDGRDMMTGVRSTEQGWTDNEIRYDGRAEAVDSTGTTRYTWDGIRVLKLEDEEGTLKQRQVHGHAPIPSVGDIALMESADGDPYAPVADQVGTVVKVLGSGATVANAYQYDAFGVSRAVTESFANPFRFAGKPLDIDPSLYYFIARQYFAQIGSFTSRDPARPPSYGRWRPILARTHGLSSVGNPYLLIGRRLEREPELLQYRRRYHAHTLGHFLSRGPGGCGDGYAVYAYASAKPVLYGDPTGLRVQEGPFVALDVANALDKRYAETNYQWGHAHCVQMCMIRNLASLLDALALEGFKEDWDWFMCRLTSDPGSCYSANQPSDYAANKAGYEAPLFDPCRCVREAADGEDTTKNWNMCFEACISHCIGASWGPDHRATPPGRMGAERGLTVEEDGYLDFRWPERKKRPY